MTFENQIPIIKNPPTPLDFDKHIEVDIPINSVWPLINAKMFYGKFLGIKGELIKHLVSKDFKTLENLQGGVKAKEIHDEVETVKEKYDNYLLRPKMIYQFFSCNADKDNIEISSDDNKTYSLSFPRNKKGICLSDYVIPKQNSILDSIAFLVTTSGGAARSEVTKLKNEGHYLHSLILSSLTLALAEACAELAHEKIRNLWGISSKAGQRFSFGYPACPDLEGQKTLFKLLDPSQTIDVKLTESCMMEPEASVSAMVFHHKDLKQHF